MPNELRLLTAAVLAVTALVVFALSRRRQRLRARRVGLRVNEYLLARCGTLPTSLNINCSIDPLWPVVVAFVDPRTGARHRLRFDCCGPHAALSLVSEKEDER